MIRLYHHMVWQLALVAISLSPVLYAEPLPLFKGEHYVASLSSEQQPVPLHRIHSWILKVRTLQGSYVENATLRVYGGMPAHRHGLPTQPVIEEIGNGNYRIRGIKFSMGGEWELWFEIESQFGNEIAKFKLQL